MNKNEIQKERYFVIAVIESINNKGKKVIEAVKIYNPVTEESFTKSLNSILQMLDNGIEIVGTRIKESKRYSEKTMEYIIKREALLTEQCYKWKELPKINGAGEVVIPGKSAVVGCTERKDGTIKYIVVNNSLKKQYLTKDEVIEGNYVGVFRNQILRPSQMRVDLLRNN